MKTAIHITDLNKEYKDGKQALQKLNLTVLPGEIFSLLGPNGAGKSTLVNILTTYLVPSSGSVKIFDQEVTAAPAAIRQQISCVPQHHVIDNYLTLTENLIFQGKLYGLKDHELSQRLAEVISTFQLEDYRHKRLKMCSGGVQRRLDIAMSMMSLPKILFLDEPTTGLDIASRQGIWQLVREVNRKYGTTVILTTHYLEEADQLSDRICMMNHGCEQAIATPQQLKQAMEQNLVRLHFDPQYQEQAQVLAEQLQELLYVQESSLTAGTLTLAVVEAQSAYHALLKQNLAAVLPFFKIEIVQPSLDEVFLAMMRQGGKS